jgi:hypothetical protein
LNFTPLTGGPKALPPALIRAAFDGSAALAQHEHAYRDDPH